MKKLTSKEKSSFKEEKHSIILKYIEELKKLDLKKEALLKKREEELKELKEKYS